MTDTALNERREARARGNPRYLAYARAHGFDADTMLAADRVLYPDEPLRGYVTWSMEKVAEWARDTGRELLILDDHEDFHAWLTVQADAEVLAARIRAERDPLERIMLYNNPANGSFALRMLAMFKAREAAS